MTLHPSGQTHPADHKRPDQQQGQKHEGHGLHQRIEAQQEPLVQLFGRFENIESFLGRWQLLPRSEVEMAPNALPSRAQLKARTAGIHQQKACAALGIDGSKGRQHLGAIYRGPRPSVVANQRSKSQHHARKHQHQKEGSKHQGECPVKEKQTRAQLAGSHGGSKVRKGAWILPEPSQGINTVPNLSALPSTKGLGALQ